MPRANPAGAGKCGPAAGNLPSNSCGIYEKAPLGRDAGQRLAGRIWERSRVVADDRLPATIQYFWSRLGTNAGSCDEKRIRPTTIIIPAEPRNSCVAVFGN